VYRFKGTPFYLDRQAERLGLPRVLTDRARHNKEIHEIATLLGQLCERWHQARKLAGRAVFQGPELEQIKGTLGRCERELEKLHALAGTAAAMCDDAYAAFGLSPPERPFAILCDFDAPSAPRPPAPPADPPEEIPEGTL